MEFIIILYFVLLIFYFIYLAFDIARHYI